MKSLLKITLSVFASLLVLMLALAAFTQTEGFRHWLKEQLLAQAQPYLHGNLSLERIEGNLISNFKFIDLAIQREQETIVRVPRLEIRLDPFALWHRRVSVSKLLLEEPLVNLRQLADSSWNIQNLVQIDTTTPAWDLHFPDLELQNGLVNLAWLDTSGLGAIRQIKNISTRLALEQVQEHTIAKIENLRLIIADFPVALEHLRARLIHQADSLRIENLSLKIGHSNVRGEIFVSSLEKSSYRAHLLARPVDLNDWYTLFPQLPLRDSVEAEAVVSGDLRRMEGTLALAHAAGAVNGRFLVQRDSSSVSYQTNAEFQRLDLAKLLPESGLHSDLNFHLDLKGAGMALSAMNSSLELAMASSAIAGHAVSHLELQAQLRNNRVDLYADVLSTGGELQLEGTLQDPAQRQNFTIKAHARGLNLARLTDDATLTSDLNFNLEGRGAKLDFARTTFDGELRAFSSQFKTIIVDTMTSRFQIQNGHVWLDTLHMRTNLGALFANGRLSLGYDNSFRFRAELGDLALVQHALAADTLVAKGVVRGRAQGPIDSLAVSGAYHLRDVKFNATQIDSLFGDFSFRRRDSTGSGEIHATGNKILLGVIPLDSAQAKIDYTLDHAGFNADFWQGESNGGALSGRYTFGETALLEVSHARFEVANLVWESDTDTIRVEIGEEEYFVHPLSLRSRSGHLYAHGKWSYHSEQDFNLGLDDFDITLLSRTLGRASDFNGRLAGEFHLTGMADAPKIAGHFLLRNGRFSEFAFDHWAGELSFEEEKLTWDFTLAQDAARTLTGEGFLPLRLSFLDNEAEFYKDRQFRIQAATTDIDLAFLRAFMPRLRNLKGSLVFDAKLENTWEDLQPLGYVRVYEGSFHLPEYGTSFRNLKMTLTISPGQLALQSRVESEKGEMEANAELSYDREKILGAQGSLMAKNFLLSRTPQLELLIDANIRADGGVEALRYNGEIAVLRSRISPKRFQQEALIDLESVPLAAETAADCTLVVTRPAEDPLAQLLQKIDGNLKIRLPRNTWIRSPEVNMEIQGELDLVQEGEVFSLFGTISVVRGNYELFGKRFEVEKDGSIVFQGDPSASPQIDLSAKYTYRLDHEKRNLYVKITGDAYKPSIAFADDDGKSLEEKEALSLLLFNAPFEQSGVSGEIDLTKAAAGLVTGLVSREITQSLGTSLQLDVIEFQSDQDFSQGSILVGKYVTNDIFISVAQDFSAAANAFRVALEYEVARFLALRASQGGEQGKATGFDVILKKEW